MRTIPYYLLFILFALLSFSQNKKKIIIHHADYSDINHELLPDAVILTGEISAEHDGMTMTCNKAYFFEKENYLKLFGNVQIVQGDTLTLNSKYAEYNGTNGFAYAQGDVVMTSPDSSLETDTLKFDRFKNLVFYDTHAVIHNKGNVLESQKGRYYTAEKKFQFFTAVKVTSEKGTVIKSNHLDFYEVPQHSYVFGPSTITNKEDYIYTENGFYDVKKDLGKMVKNSYIWYDKRKIEGDSIYYSKAKDFASATNNVRITDTINKSKITGHYAEMYKAKDSTFVTKKALVSMKSQEGDSVYMHAPRILLTGKDKERVIRAYHDARILRDSMSGKADSIHWSEKAGLTQMIGKPVLWNGDSQLTGRFIHLISDSATQKMDSLKVLEDAFIIQKDTIGDGFDQMKGVNLYGKFKENKLHELDLVKNAEIIYHMYNDKNELVGIDKGICSHINVLFEDGKITTATKYVSPESELLPDALLPKNARQLRGFSYRIEERINTLADIFTNEELEKEKNGEQARDKMKEGHSKPINVQPETIKATPGLSKQLKEKKKQTQNNTSNKGKK
ncbi:LPS export ABC transporter periplasmic protein LptC [Myroides marinus]|uniref:OstA-like protein n=1 Tax=Myroides marinus TaxID=703342 RepID=A0A1H6U842_9FLAO|nr:OstA-like protein [Myroides marinus]MDR0195047.1 OstA-like protein [Myroides sp.]MDM1347977.1 LPS export ABC transporter periplasmic protein LptC [Myroides marinus]MDM1351549.1 LPS export ABC transporter periplasmic protein LptC [Myroides marinus]MDM1354892.1 LPS export ABC transporter periplasmic protein LptC [Myroides marinus]MDM1358712.1 LPS export ABC transporter periplasmic protein LptC [Myroides marinus]